MSALPDPCEIEIRFLVTGDRWPRAAQPRRIDQGYLSADPDRVVRVRVVGDAAWLTVKGRAVGGVRAEFEYAIPVEHAIHMLALCGDRRVTKLRHVLPIGGFTWEIDEFTGANAGLVIAEVEVADPAQFDVVRARLPSWVEREITDDARYANSTLAQRPFSTW